MDAPSGVAIGKRWTGVTKSKESDKAVGGAALAAGGVGALKLGTDYRVGAARRITSARNQAMSARITAANAKGHLSAMEGQRAKVARDPSGKSTGRLHTIGMQREAVKQTSRMEHSQARRATATARLLRKPIGHAQGAKLAGAAAFGVGTLASLKGVAGMNQNRRDRKAYGSLSA